MTEEINYRNNPLHGLGLKKLVTELVEHYDFSILYAYLNLNCFKTNPSIESSIKFLKKTQWARERVEAFYLYQFKNLPKASFDQLELSPRERIIPDGQVPGEPAELSLDDAPEWKDKRQETKQRKNSPHWDTGAERRGKRKATSPYRQSEKKQPEKKEECWRETSDNQMPEDEAGGQSSSVSVDPWAKWK